MPVRAGERALGVLAVLRSPGAAFDEEEVNLLSTLAGQLAVTLQKTESAAQTARLAAQMATLYDLGLETSALRDLQALFEKATEEAGRLIKCDHASVLRLDPDNEELRMFAAWALDPHREPYTATPFQVGQGVAGTVAQTCMAVLVNDPADHPSFVERGNKVARLLCVPLQLLRPGAAAPGALRRAQRDARAGLARLHARRPRIPDALRQPALHRGRQLHGLRRGAARAASSSRS